MIEDRRSAWFGTLFALLSFLIWGFLPLYWKWLGGVPATEMLAHRVFWAAVILIVTVPVLQWRELRAAFRDSRAGEGAFAAGNGLVTGLLVGAGIVTVIPLLLFGAGARRIPLSRVGFLQYIAPTAMLLIGTVLYDEPFTRAHAVSFTLIWVALAIFTVTMVRAGVRPREK